MATWIDFKELRANLKFEDILRHYDVEVKKKGDQHHGFCPLPNHNGKKNSVSFSANLTRGIFNCFGCRAKGNLLEFAAMMERVDPDNGAALRTVAIKLRDKFCPELGKPAPKPQPSAAKPVEAELPIVAPPLPVLVNAPLDFELKRLEQNHPYLEKRGFTAETIRKFDLGFCAKGLLSGRVAIPIHDSESRLVGYCGRLVEDKQISEEHPRYKFPPKRERNKVLYEFHKSELLYNGHRLKLPVQELVVVEGFPSVWWLTQMGSPNVVSPMGSVCSKTQAELILKLVPESGRVWVMPDGDEAGIRFAHEVFERIAPHRFLHWLKLEDGKQPTDYCGAFFCEKLGK